MKRISSGVLALLLTASLLLSSGCGYLLYPERQGLKQGRLDPVVVLLDGAGLLFGLLPGVVAFAVDFSNGTIYLPPGEESALDKHTSQQTLKSWETITFNGTDKEHVAIALSHQLSQDIRASQMEFYQRSGSGDDWVRVDL